MVLFGSVARGESNRESDVDIAVVYSNKEPETIKYINSLAPEHFQLLHLTLDELTNEPTLAGALSGEGILLHGKPVTLSLNDDALKSQMIITYNTSQLDRNTQSTLYRALYGGSSTYKKGEVKMKKYYPGIVEKFHPKNWPNQ